MKKLNLNIIHKNIFYKKIIFLVVLLTNYSCYSYKKNIINGIWKVQDINLELEKNFQDTSIWNFTPESIKIISQERQFLDNNLSLDYVIKFNNNKTLIIENNTEYYYHLSDEYLILHKLDMVFRIPYLLKDNKLIITNYIKPIKRTIVFEKIKTNANIN